MVFSNTKDKYGNITGFTSWFDFKGRKQRAYNQLDTDILGLKSVLEYTDSDYLSKIPELMADCSQEAQKFAKSMKESGASIKHWETSQRAAIDKNNTLKSSFGALKTTVTSVGKALASAALNMGAWAAVSWVFTKIGEAISNYVNRVENANNALDELSSKWDDLADKQKEAADIVSTYGDEFERLSKGVNTQTGENISLSDEEYQRYIEANNAIANSAIVDIEGVTVAYDEQGNAIVRLTSSAQTLADAYDTLAQKTRDEILNSEVMKNWNTSQESNIQEDKEWQEALDGVRKAFEKDTKNTLTSGQEDFSSNIFSYFQHVDTVEKADLETVYGVWEQVGSGNKQDLYNILINELTAKRSTLLRSINESLTLPRAYAKTIIEDTFINQSGLFEDFDERSRKIIADSVDYLDYSYFYGKSGSEVKADISSNLIAPFSSNVLQDAFSNFLDTQEAFQKGEISYGEYLDQGDEIKKVFRNSSINEAYISAFEEYMGLDGKNPFDIYSNHLKTAIKDADEQWIKSKTRKELEFANIHIKTPEGNPVLSKIDFDSEYEKYTKEQALMFDVLNEEFVALAEAQNKAKEIAQSIGTDGVLTHEQYKTLLEQSPDYIDAISGETGYFTIDTEKLRQINQEKIKTQRNRVQEAIGQNENNIEEEVKNLDRLNQEWAKFSENESEEWRDVKLAQIESSKALIDSYIDQKTELRALANEMDYATSSYKRWLDAQDTAEKSDGFKSARSAIEEIRSGDKSGRKNTEKYKAAQEYILGENATLMSKEKREKALSRAESFYDDDGNFSLAAWQKASLEAGAQDENGNWKVNSIDEYAEKLGLSKEYTAQAILALSEYNGSYGVDVSQALVDQAKSVLPETEIDANTQAIINLTNAIIEDTKTRTPEKVEAKQINQERIEELGYDAESGKFGNVKVDTAYSFPWVKEDGSQNPLYGKDWGNKLEKENRRGKSSVWATYDTFGSEIQGNRVQVAYTPTMWGENGTVSFLSQRSVHQYIKDLIAKAEDQYGKEWTEDNLLELDRQGDGKYSNLIAGVDRGKGENYIPQLVNAINLAAYVEESSVVPSFVGAIDGASTNIDALSTAAASASTALSELGVDNPNNPNNPNKYPVDDLYEIFFKAYLNHKAYPEEKPTISGSDLQIVNYFRNTNPELFQRTRQLARDTVEENYSPETAKQFLEMPVEVDTTQAHEAVETLNEGVEMRVGVDATQAYKTIEDIQKEASTQIDTVVVLKPRVAEEGNAYASGTQNAPGGLSLVGEEEPEIVVSKKKKRWYLAKGPQLVNLGKGDIVYNGSQTKDILRGSSSVGGNAYSDGYGDDDFVFETKKRARERLKPNSNGKNGEETTTSSSSTKDYDSILESFDDLYDWIERALEVAADRTDDLIDAADDYVGYNMRNIGLNRAIASTAKEREKNEAAYTKYMEQAAEVQEQTDLSDAIVKRIQNGTIDISEYDETTRNKIEEYKEWYDLAEACKDTIDELNDQEEELRIQRLDNIIDDYENRLAVLTDDANRQQKEIELKKAEGSEIQTSAYSNLILNAKRQLNMLTKEYSVLEAELQDQVANGTIKKNSEEWYNYNSTLNEISDSITECKINIAEFGDAIYELRLSKLSNLLGLLQETQTATEKLMSLHDAQGVDNAEGYYSILIGNGFKQIENLEKQNELLKAQMKNLEVDSDKYQELLSTIESNEEAIAEMKISQEQWNDAIADLKIASLEEQKELLQETNDEYEKQLKYEEALEALEKAKTQRTKLVFRQGVGFRYEADQEAIDEAQKTLDDLLRQAKIDEIEDQIESLEDNKKNDNVYSYSGNELASGLVIGSTEYKDMVGKLLSASTAQPDLTSVAETSTSALGSVSSKSVSLSIGDVNVSGVDNAEDLAKDIVTRLPESILQELYKD